MSESLSGIPPKDAVPSFKFDIQNWDTLNAMLRGSLPIPSVYYFASAVTEAQRDIDDISRTIVALENKRRSVHKRLDAYNSLVSPIRMVPCEILRRIFSLICEDNSSTIGPNDICIPPLTLSRVCSTWRDIVMDYPALWSNLSVTIPFAPNAVRSCHGALRIALERSGTHPLNFSVFIHGHQTPDRSTLALLASSCSRWATATIDDYSGLILPPDDDFDDDFPIHDHNFKLAIQGKLHLLEKLSLRLGLPNNINTFSVAPNLRSVEFYESYPRNITLPWNQIRSFHFYNHRIHDEMSCLSPFLPMCSKTLDSFSYDTPVDRSASVMHRLVMDVKTVQLGVVTFTALLRKFSEVTMPRVESLTLVGSEKHWQETLDQSHFETLRTKLLISPTSITLRGVIISDEACMHLLRFLPSVKEFVYTDEIPLYPPWKPEPDEDQPVRAIRPLPFTDTFFGKLNASDPHEENILLPQLTHLTVSITTKTFTEQVLVDMIKSRYHSQTSDLESSIARLQSVTVRVLDDTLDAQPFESLRCFNRVGLKIKIVDKTGCLFD